MLSRIGRWLYRQYRNNEPAGQLISGVLGALVGYLFFQTRAGPYLERVQTQFLTFLRDHVNEALFQFGFVFLVLSVAIGLYILRSMQRRIYASVEIMFGVFAAVFAANELYKAPTPDSRIKALFATVAGVYIIVRGIDNWRQSTKS